MKIHLGDFIKKTAAEVSLSEAERTKMRSVVSEYMAMKPVRGADANTKPKDTVHAWYAFMRRPVAFALIAVLLVSVSGAGVSYAAEGALPGDILYPVKVGINEPVQAALAVTSEAKASVAAHRAVARLNEASALAAKGKLTPATEEKLASAFEAQADVASKHVSDLEVKDSPAAITVASDVESEFAAHVEILEEVNSEAARTLRTVALAKARIFSHIRNSAEGANDVSSPAVAPAPVVAVAKVSTPMAFTTMRAELSASSAEDASASPALPPEAGKDAALRMGSASKDALVEAEGLFKKLSVKLSANEATQATTTISGARAGIADADAEFASGAYIAAFHSYQDAFVSLKRLDVFMKTSARDGIRITADPLPVRIETEVESVPSVSAGSSSGNTGASDETPPPSLRIAPLDGND